MSIFVQTTKMDSQTIYHENGGVTITPAVYELGKHQIEAYAKSQRSVGKDEEWEACL